MTGMCTSPPTAAEVGREITGNFPGLAGARWVSRVLHPASKSNGLRSFDGHRNDDFVPYVFMTTDTGTTWKSIASDLPAGGPVRVIREDMKNPNLLFVGTEFAAFVSFDRGVHWLRLMNGMPTVAVADLVVHPRDGDLIAGTHGRSAYVMDISPLQELTGGVLNKDLHLFQSKRRRLFGTGSTRTISSWAKSGSSPRIRPTALPSAIT